LAKRNSGENEFEDAGFAYQSFSYQGYFERMCGGMLEKKKFVRNRGVFSLSVRRDFLQKYERRKHKIQAVSFR
jgi:hypothetical protein